MAGNSQCARRCPTDCKYADVTDVETEALKEAGRYHISHKIPRWYLVEPRFVVCVASKPILASVHPPALPHPEESQATPALPTLPHSFGGHVQIKKGLGGGKPQTEVSFHMTHSCCEMLYRQGLPIQLSVGNSAYAVFTFGASWFVLPGILSFTLLNQFAGEVRGLR